MKAEADKPNVLMVGAFPPSHSKTIYGGQVVACTSLRASSFVVDHAVRTLDTTQISNPPPPLAVRLPYATKRLLVYIRESIFHKPDVVILFFADGASACEKGLMVLLARLLRIRVMVFPRAGSLIERYATHRLFAFFLRHTIGRADIFLCQGRIFQNFAIEKLGFNQVSAPIIPNWTASPQHLDIGARRIYGQQPTCVKLLFLGWLEEFKGVFDLLEALRILHRQGVRFHCTFGGDGHALHEAKLFVERNELSDNVTFAGWVGEESKQALLAANQLFVLPSWSEGLPNAMIEAMCAGLACVVTNVGAISDYVAHEREALIVKPRDPVALAAAIVTLIIDHGLRDALGRAGHDMALARFSVEQGTKRISEAIAQLMSEK